MKNKPRKFTSKFKAKVKVATLYLLLFLPAAAFTQVIPQPVSIQKSEGVYNIKTSMGAYFQGDGLYDCEQFFKEAFPSIRVMSPQTAMRLDIAIERRTIEGGEEAYQLSISPEGIRLEGQPAGIFYGLQTLRQLEHQHEGLIPCGVIADQPRFKWRGMHLDVSRHFFPVEFVKKYIDILALHKMNTFHWHLTDDQGWRIEIKQYPLLTEIGAQRSETIVGKNFDPYKGDGKPHGGFYTQDEVKEIVAYAKRKFITVVPEIEMPGHSQAALSAYPIFSCNRTPLDVYTKWGVTDDVFCPKDTTFAFIFDILDEVMGLFPSKFIHIGGDEVPKTRWKKCAHCQGLMREKGLKDEHELQSYFIRKVDEYVTSKDRNIIGWDEILEGGLAPNAAVMSWRGEDGGIEAARQQHEVVMCPGSHCYFDHYQGNKATEPLAIGGFTTVEKVYSYEPVPAKLAPSEHKYILGAQGNLWTEYIPTTSHAEYMALPRLCALAEVLWSKKEGRNFGEFSTRLTKHFSLLDVLKINYAKSIYDLKATSKPAKGGLLVELASNFKHLKVFYTINNLSGGKPLPPIRYKKPFKVSQNSEVVAFCKDKSQNVGNPLKLTYHINAATGKPITVNPAPSKYYNYGGASTLVDGIVGQLPWTGSEWLGWSGQTVEMVIDLQYEKAAVSIQAVFLHDEASWIHLPKQLDYWVSMDGENYELVKTFSNKDLHDNYKDLSFKSNAKARYVKIHATKLEAIPEGKPGAGSDAWMFMTEVKVD